ncbi:MAG TPA: hypothetical protein VLF40_04965 [Candidatus Saccharimonadales bacterium]|nr:hypothetical protein [Candidatus Saccharimonadales bacterium]
MTLVQAMTAAEVSSTAFINTGQKLKTDPPGAVMELLAHARFFSESCGWFALAARRLRHDTTDGIGQLLTDNKQLIDNLYGVRVAVNHHYNEDLADEYRKNNYTPGRHLDKFAFKFRPKLDDMSFQIGTLEVSIAAQLAAMQKIEKALLEL